MAARSLPQLYHIVATIRYGDQTMRLKILQGSATPAILTAIRNRFDIPDDDGLMLVDKDGVDQVIDHNLDTGNYTLETTKKQIEVKKTSSTTSSTKSESKTESKKEEKEEKEEYTVDQDELPSSEVIQQSKAITEASRLKGLESYKTLYQKSLKDNDGFWKEMANRYIDWFTPFTKVTSGGFKNGDIKWFLGGKLNVAHNCVDKHLSTRGDKVALLWEGDDPRDIRRVTYKQLHQNVCKLANALKSYGVKKGDTVCIYMPMVPEAAFAMLACARLGAPHSVVFAGFSEDSLCDRIVDGHTRFIITADEGVRGGKNIPLKTTVDAAINAAAKQKWEVKTVFVYRRTGATVPWNKTRDVWYHDAIADKPTEHKAEAMDSEDPLFMLYTSGSTGKPKGILHTTGGYLLYTAFTTQYTFDLRESDIYACVADIGWITGHSYILYGPLCNGATTFMFESTPLYPDAGRYWDMVERHKINVFYTAPTALRSLMRFGERFVKRFDRSSLRILGTVGEPINPEAWKWYYNVVGDAKCTIVDTFWQTETGGHMITPLPGATPLKPGSATLPFFGIEPVLLDPHTGKEIEGLNKKGVLCVKRPWPGITRTIFGDHDRYMKTYLNVYPGYYFTGDGALRDGDGFYWILGRVDDVVNVSGHRIGSAEIEHALVSHPAVAEAAVVGIPHEIKGQSLFAYVTTKIGVATPPSLINELSETVKKHVGSFAKPDDILLAPALPKTRSGKIMRRLLRKIASQDTDNLGDITTLDSASVVESLIAQVKEMRKKK